MKSFPLRTLKLSQQRSFTGISFKGTSDSESEVGKVTSKHISGRDFGFLKSDRLSVLSILTTRWVAFFFLDKVERMCISMRGRTAKNS